MSYTELGWSWLSPFAEMGTPDPIPPGSNINTAFNLDDVAEILGHFSYSPEGFGSEQVCGIFRLKDGRYAVVEAGCDTSGWG